jgi:hypothetical protein
MVISVKLLGEGGQMTRRTGVSVVLADLRLRVFQRSEHYT